jgi:hypothetical protein
MEPTWLADHVLFCFGCQITSFGPLSRVARDQPRDIAPVQVGTGSRCTTDATSDEERTTEPEKKSTHQPGYDINRFCERVEIFSLFGRWDGRQMEAGREVSGPEEGDGPLLPVTIRPGVGLSRAQREAARRGSSDQQQASVGQQLSSFGSRGAEGGEGTRE